MSEATKQIDDGGPAFPGSFQWPNGDGTYWFDNVSGMMLRDYFAAHALHGELASQTEDSVWVDEKRLAIRAYSIADAMLAARKEESK